MMLTAIEDNEITTYINAVHIAVCSLLLFHDVLVIVKKRLTVCENQVLFRKHQLAPCCSTVTLECALEQKSLNY